MKLHSLVETDYRRALLGYLMAQGLDEKVAWGKLPEHLRLSNSTASRDKDEATKKRWLVTRFAEELFEEDLLGKIREETAHYASLEDGMEKELRKLSGGVLKSVWVFNAGDKADPNDDQGEWDWQIGNLARNSDWLVQKLLLKSRDGIAVGWGKTIAESIAAVADRFKRGLGETGANGHKRILVIPTVGTPPSASASDMEHSSTKLAANASEAINGTWKEYISLDNCWPVIPPGLNKEERKGFLRAIQLGGGFEKIFGLPNHTHDQRPLIEVVDTALTSAGAFHNESFFLKQMEQTGSVPLAELKELAVGDMGSALIPNGKINGSRDLKKRFEEILHLLPGIQLAHYQKIAKRTADLGINGPAGVVLLALNGNKAKIVLNCVRQKAVSVLIVDYHLAASLKALLAEEKKVAGQPEGR